MTQTRSVLPSHQRRTSSSWQILAVVGVLLLALPACAVQSGPPGIGVPPGGDNHSAGATGQSGTEGVALDGRTFISTGSTGHDLVEGSVVRMVFESGQLSVQAGCNNLFASYAVEQQTLRVTAMGSTQMGCEQDLMEQDQWLAGFLEGGPSAVVDGDELTLSDGATELVLTDRVVADPDRPLEGTTWQLESHRSDDALSHIAGMEKASLRFDGQGRLQVDTGCNRGSATYAVEGDTVVIGPVMLTRMACPEPAMEIETLLTQAIDEQTLTVSIEADLLTLEGTGGGAGGGGLGLRAAPDPSDDVSETTS